ncbi:MAG: hypothetical protein LBH90_01900 [Tannerella sp.]|nr:hypothetical protein [Tannerella sp.]
MKCSTTFNSGGLIRDGDSITIIGGKTYTEHAVLKYKFRKWRTYHIRKK